jgi:antirestriction protein ArdC
MSAYADITRKIISVLEQGQETGTWTLPWRQVNSRPFNPVTGTRYRGVNSLNLAFDQQIHAFEGVGAWATYKQWASIDAQVRQGERASGQVMVWREVKLKEREDPLTGEFDTAMRPIFSKVFHHSQVDGWEPEKGVDMTGRVEAVDEMVRAFGIQVRESDRASYSPGNDWINMPPRDHFVDGPTRTAQEGYYGVLLHELVHSTGHASRLGRTFGKEKGDQNYAREELVAELGSAFLSADLGINQRDEIRPDHVQYIQAWLQVLRDDPKIVATASRAAEQAADYMKPFIAPEHRQALGIRLPDEERARQEQAHTERDARIRQAANDKWQEVAQLPPGSLHEIKTCLRNPRVVHTTNKGKELWGRVLDLPMDECRKVDAYAFKKNEGVFVREKNLKELTPFFQEQDREFEEERRAMRRGVDGYSSGARGSVRVARDLEMER